MTKIAIIDYGSGNLRSAAKAFERVLVGKGEVVVTSTPSDLADATHIVLPGVGAFADCMSGLSGLKGMISSMEKEVLEKKKPFIGICVGMQLLADEGHEFGVHKGLGWIKGTVKKFETTTLKVPHMGWNDVTIKKSDIPLFQDIKTGDDFYFVHSYYFAATNENNVLATADYDGKFPAIIGAENIFGTQFHPEKSQKSGLKFLENFVRVRI